MSQSFWEGALIGIPFIAEGQRLAPSAIEIDSAVEAQPVDVFVRYESYSHAPDQKHNHVGLFLGRDSAQDGWVIESRGGRGVLVTRIDEFPAQGGIRRFVHRERNLNVQTAANALRWAPKIPKLGRLGAKQYRHNDVLRYPHKGLDIYAEPDTIVNSPHPGRVDAYFDCLENSHGVSISNAETPGLTTRLLNVEKSVPSGSFINAGSLSGVLFRPHRDRSSLWKD